MSSENPIPEESPLEIPEAAVAGIVAGGAIIEAVEQGPINVVALNNRIVNMRDSAKQAEAIATLSSEEVSAVAREILATSEQYGFDNTYSLLKNFQFTPRLIAQPEVTQALRSLLGSGHTHIYNIDRIVNIPGFSPEILNDPEVKNGVKGSMQDFVTNHRAGDFGEIWGVVDKMGIPPNELREIAESIKGSRDQYQEFVQHFGVKTLYPEVR